jgi:hypothetical protein
MRFGQIPQHILTEFKALWFAFAGRSSACACLLPRLNLPQHAGQVHCQKQAMGKFQYTLQRFEPAVSDRPGKA